LWNQEIIKYSIWGNYKLSFVHLSNNVYLTDYFSVNGDIWYITLLFSEELAPILIILGLILLYSMVGVIVILKQKNDI